MILFLSNLSKHMTMKYIKVLLSVFILSVLTLSCESNDELEITIDEKSETDPFEGGGSTDDPFKNGGS